MLAIGDTTVPVAPRDAGFRVSWRASLEAGGPAKSSLRRQDRKAIVRGEGGPRRRHLPLGMARGSGGGVGAALLPRHSSGDFRGGMALVVVET